MKQAVPEVMWAVTSIGCLGLAIWCNSLRHESEDELRATRTQLLVAQSLYQECYGRIEAVKRRDAAREKAIRSGRYLPLPLGAK